MTQPLTRVETRIRIDGAEILFKNFEGRETPFNRAGNKNFCVVIPEDQVEALLAEGWNVRPLESREEGGEPKHILQVNVGYKAKPARVVMITSRGRTDLDEETVELLDDEEFLNVDLIINPYNYRIPPRGKIPETVGVSAYVKTMFITIEEDELERKYADIPDVGTGPFGQEA